MYTFQLPSLYALDSHLVSVAEQSPALCAYLTQYRMGAPVPTAVHARLSLLATIDMLPMSNRLKLALEPQGPDAVLVSAESDPCFVCTADSTACTHFF